MCVLKSRQLHDLVRYAGVSLSFLEIKDDKWLDYLEMPVETYSW